LFCPHGLIATCREIFDPLRSLPCGLRAKSLATNYRSVWLPCSKSSKGATRYEAMVFYEHVLGFIFAPMALDEH
jgi:hypothetical protein